MNKPTKQYIFLMKTEEDEEYQMVMDITEDLGGLQSLKKELTDAAEGIEIKIFKVKEVA